MKVRRLFSVGLSIVVIFTQLTLPLSRAQASPAAQAGPTQTASQQPRPWLPLDHGQIVIPVTDDATDSKAIDPPRSSVPPVTIASPATPVAPQGTLEVPLGVGNNNYGQTQRDTDNPQNHPGVVCGTGIELRVKRGLWII